MPSRVGGGSNNEGTFRPYDPSRIQGDMSPNMSAPAAKGGCGGVGQLIMAVVAVAVAVWAPQFLSTLTQGLLSATSPAGLAIGGAAGSIASQAVGMATGVQEKFSWKGVALSALSAGIGGELGAQSQLFNLTSSPAVNTAIRLATGNVITQGIGVATGLQKKFDWKGVAASAAGGFAGAAVGARLPESLNPFVGRVVSGFAAGTAAAIARGGKVAIQQVAVDAFGNALGQSLAAGSGQMAGSASGAGDDRLGAFIEQNQGAWDQRQANYDRMVGTFGNPTAYGRADDTLLAAGPGYNGGTGSGLGSVNFSGDRLPSMFPDPVRLGFNARGGETWSTDANTYPVDTHSIMGEDLPAMDGTGLRYGSIKADQGYWASLGGIAGSDLSFADKASMAWGATKYYFRNSDEAQGAVQMVGGGLEVAGAVSLSSTGLGAAIGVPLAFHGGDTFGTGFNRMMGLGSNPTVTYQLVESATGSSTIASAVDQGIPFLAGVASVGQGLRLAESQVLNSTVCRGLTAQDAAALENGMGLTAKAPNGVWTAEDHVANFKFGTRGGAQRNDPWIGTTRDYEVVIGPKGYDSGNGITAINLNRVSSTQVEVWQTASRSNIYKLSEPYQRSIWAQEVSIYQSVPSQAIYTPFSPISQVPVYRPMTYGLTLGGTGFINNNQGGSQ